MTLFNIITMILFKNVYTLYMFLFKINFNNSKLIHCDLNCIAQILGSMIG